MDIENNIIFETVSGSKSYGTDTKLSDTDYRGVCILKDKTYYFGCGVNTFSQKDKGWGEDRVIYDIRKFMSLAADNNPNILELLFVDKRHWIKTSSYWDRVVDNRDKFLSKNVRYRYLGYAFSQLGRIKRHRGYLLSPPKKHPERADFGLPDRKLISSDNMGAFQWLIATLLKGSVDELNLSEETKEELRNINYIGLVQRGIPDNTYKEIKELTGATDEWVDIMMREKAYINAMNEWNSYQTWKTNRNSDRAKLEAKYGYDSKHALHLVRLLRQGIEILESGKLEVYRSDREELLSIRNGAWSYDKLIEYADKCEKKAIELYNTSKLPKTPNRAFIDKLCCEIIEDYIYNEKRN